jgi:hypothetical protein
MNVWEIVLIFTVTVIAFLVIGGRQIIKRTGGLKKLQCKSLLMEFGDVVPESGQFHGDFDHQACHEDCENGKFEQ